MPAGLGSGEASQWVAGNCIPAVSFMVRSESGNKASEVSSCKDTNPLGTSHHDPHHFQRPHISKYCLSEMELQHTNGAAGHTNLLSITFHPKTPKSHVLKCKI